MKFEVGQRYATKEFYERLGIGRSTWKNRKNEILEDFSNYYNYEVEYSGRTIYYHILSNSGEEYEYERKNQKKLKMRDKVYDINVLKEVYTNPLNTAKNIARATYNKPEVQYLGYTNSTHYEYSRLRVRKFFGTTVDEKGDFETMEERKGYISEKIWCRADVENNVYIEMPPEHVKYFKDCLKQRFTELEKQQDKEFEQYELYEAGQLTKEELKDIVVYNRYITYCDAKGDFHKKYGYYPIKVPKYVIYPNVIKEYNLEFAANY